jgi:hypothetical protein
MHCILMYPLYHHLGFKCIVSFYLFAEFQSRNAYREAKLKLLKEQQHHK